MYENHQKLKTAREKSRSLESACKVTSEVLEREKQKNQRLETEVKNYQARQKHLEQIKILKMKRAWVVSMRGKYRYRLQHQIMCVNQADKMQFRCYLKSGRYIRVCLLRMTDFYVFVRFF